MRHRRCGTSRGRWRPGFVYQGEASAHRGGAAARRAQRRSSPPPPSSTSCRTTTRSATARSATGLKARAEPKAIEAALAITLLAPMVPMLFMGEEWGSKAPFPFFCDFEGELAEAVRQGRRREFAGAYAKYGDEVPDPLGRIDLPIRGAGLGLARPGGRTQAAGAGAGVARDPPRENHSAAGRRGVRRGACGGQRFADGELAHGRWRHASALANLSDDEIARPEMRATGTLIWGGEIERQASRRGRCSGASG